MAAKSRTAKFYASNPEARRKRQEYQAEYDKRPEQRKKRAALNKYNKEQGTYGNRDGLDASHKNGRIVGFRKASGNRGDKNNSSGDRRARGNVKFGRKRWL